MPFAPDQITKELVLAAVKKIDDERIKLRPSSQWDVIIDGKSYPPIEILKYAHELLNGERIWNEPEGENTNTVLDDMGFLIRAKGNKADEIKAIISIYKEFITESKLINEFYKWRNIHKYRGRPDVNAPDFAKELTDLKFDNLVYQLTPNVIQLLAKHDPERMRELFRDLFNENEALIERIPRFIAETQQLFKEIDPKNSPHIGERETAVFLTYHDPENNTLYMDKFYRTFCKIMGVKVKKAGYKYVHYLKYVKEFVDQYIMPDAELLQMVKEMLPADAYPDEAHLVLAQDILLQYYEYEPIPGEGGGGSTTTTEYKGSLNQILYGPPGTGKTYNSINKAVQIADPEFMSKITDLAASRTDITERYRELVEEGRIVFTTFHQSMCYEDFIEGIKPIMESDTDCQIQYEITPGIFKRICEHAATEMDQYLSSVDSEETSDDLDSDYESADIEVAAKNPSLGDNSLSPDSVFDRAYEHIISEINSSISRGQSYYFETKNGAKHFAISILPDNNIWIERENAPSMKPYTIERDKLKTLYLHFHDIEHLTIKDHDDYLRHIIGQGANNGPTYIAILSSLDQVAKTLIQKQALNNRTVYSIEQTPYLNDSVESSQPISREDLFDYTYELLLQEVRSSIKKTGKYGFETMESAIHNAIEVSDNGVIKIKRLGSKILPYNVPIDILKLLFMKTRDINNLTVTKTGDLIKGMKGGSCNRPTYWAITKKLLELSKEVKLGTDSRIDSVVKDTPLITPTVTAVPIPLRLVAYNYVLIIDEINRGNVSQIFGELITLIETDKRTGNPEALEITLPYSKDRFSVPPNLYIIGTMNTADRSVEALDIALRRRFSFQEMPPLYSVLDANGTDLLDLEIITAIKLKSILRTINRRIEKLLDKDHQIGHSYFLRVKNIHDLRDVFRDKIIPLLEEYFYGDPGKIGLVLGSGFVKIKDMGTAQDFFADMDYDDLDNLSERAVYDIQVPVDNEDFEAAIRRMMN